MRHGILVAGLLMLVSSGPAYAQPASKAAIEKALIAHENTINEAVAKGDVKTFNSLIAPDAVSADMAGFMRVADFVKVIDQMKIASWHIMNPQVVWIDDKSAVVAYTWMGKGTYMNQPVPETVFASTVWTERNGTWVAVFHQETAAAPPAPAKKE